MIKTRTGKKTSRRKLQHPSILFLHHVFQEAIIEANLDKVLSFYTWEVIDLQKEKLVLEFAKYEYLQATKPDAPTIKAEIGMQVKPHQRQLFMSTYSHIRIKILQHFIRQTSQGRYHMKEGSVIANAYHFKPLKDTTTTKVSSLLQMHKLMANWIYMRLTFGADQVSKLAEQENLQAKKPDAPHDLPIYLPAS
ncbi:hypothetical protein E3N88_19702 [Mikania micrantha]|uniref:Uncharacterized protein n=1 Tax=Mikania micrantha TaxID=192012 RepID=A0A5N6NP35_9ASTR|nr:hypothetical protein E3N88_19702 [Mikania micrantha]